MDELPFVDEHTIEVDAPPNAVWDAVVAVSGRSFGGGRAGAFARLVGCEETEASGTPGEQGSTVVGFRVETADPPRELDLAGRHHFSQYRLTFLLEPIEDDRTRLRAVTHARFPGPHGRAYRTLVIGTRMHVLVVRRLLNGIAARAEGTGEPRASATTAER